MFEIMQRVQPEKKIKAPLRRTKENSKTLTKSAKNLAYSVKLRNAEPSTYIRMESLHVYFHRACKSANTYIRMKSTRNLPTIQNNHTINNYLENDKEIHW
jgi:hypothetical protein